MTQEERNSFRKELATLKMHVVHLDEWLRQANNMIYELEEKVLDSEDLELENFIYRLC